MHELISPGYANWKDVRRRNRVHFFGVAAQLMWRILVDFARARHQDKRGGAMRQVSFEKAAKMSAERTAELIALDEALERLAAIDPRRSRMVELRFFGGLSEEETAEVLKVSPHTVWYTTISAEANVAQPLPQSPSL
jgi:RNA polymerase sigma factor (TIGR02999 family)